MMNGKGSLLEGQYDEAQSHQEFLDALSAWRTGGPAKAPSVKKTTVPTEKVNLSCVFNSFL